jgi:formamidopyrimidine-DNA glycosylase
MPELPEVETTRIGLAPQVEGRIITSVSLRRSDLRWPIPEEILKRLPGQSILSLRRRAKYLLMDLAPGSALFHLGMSGCLRVLPKDFPVGRHDHFDIVLNSGQAIRFTDPRRFGCLLWQRGVYKGRKPCLTPEQAEQVRQRVQSGESKAELARAYSVSRETIYAYLRV